MKDNDSKDFPFSLSNTDSFIFEQYNRHLSPLTDNNNTMLMLRKYFSEKPYRNDNIDQQAAFERFIEEKGISIDHIDSEENQNRRREEAEQKRAERFKIAERRPAIRLETSDMLVRKFRINAIKNLLVEMTQLNDLVRQIHFLDKQGKALLIEYIAPEVERVIEQGHYYLFAVLLKYVQLSESNVFQWLERAAQARQINIIGLLLLANQDLDISHLLKKWQTDAQENDANASYILGSLYQRGYGIKKDADQAKKYLLDAKAGRHPQAILELGRLHRKAGKYDAARDCFETVIDYPELKGAPDFELGHMIQSGEACKVEFKATAEDYYNSAMRLGHQKSKTYLGRIYIQGNDEAQKQTAIKLWQEAAQNKEVHACFELVQYYQVNNKEKYVAFARECSLLLEIDERLGIPSSIGLLGRMYEQGHYVYVEGPRPQDIKKAYHLYKKAVELGALEYQQYLAEAAYQLGKHIFENNHKFNWESIAYLQEAEQLGSHHPFFLLGVYHDKKKRQQSEDKAEYYYTRALDYSRTHEKSGELYLKLACLKVNTNKNLEIDEQKVCDYIEKALSLDDANTHQESAKLYLKLARIKLKADRNLEIDEQKVCDYIEKALSLDDSNTHQESGELYYRLARISPDEQRACDYAERAASLEHVDVREFYYNLANNKLDTDEAKACEYAKRAEELGHPDIQDFNYHLAINKLKTDAKEACKLLKKLAQQGYRNAKYKLGELYYKGNYYNQLGEKKQSTGIALEWWRKAALQGHVKAIKRLQEWYLTFPIPYFRNATDSILVTYHYTMAQQEKLYNILYDPRSKFWDNKSWNRAIITLLLDDDDLKPEEKSNLLKEFINELVKKNIPNPEEYITTCRPSDQKHRIDLKTLLENISDPSIDEIVKKIKKELIGVQSVLERAEQKLEGILAKQNEALVDTVRREIQSGDFPNYQDNHDKTLIFVALQLKNLIVAFRKQDLDKDQPATREDVDHFQSFNQIFGMILEDKHVKNALKKDDEKALYKIYQELLVSERDLRQATINPSKEVSFEKALEIRLNALYTGVKAFGSDYIQRKPTTNEKITGGVIRIIISLCHAIPIIGAMGEFTEASAEVIHTFHKVIAGSHLTLAAMETIEIGETGLTMSGHKLSEDEQLVLVYQNLGGQANPLIRVLINALKQRFQPIVNELCTQDAEKLGYAMARHIETYLRSGYYKKSAQELLRTLIALCTYGKMNTKETVKWGKREVTLAQLIARFDLECDYVRDEAHESCKLKPSVWFKEPTQPVTLPTLPASEPLGYLPAFDWEIEDFVKELQNPQISGLAQVDDDEKKYEAPDSDQTMDDFDEDHPEHIQLKEKLRQATEDYKNRDTRALKRKFEQAKENLAAYRQKFNVHPKKRRQQQTSGKQKNVPSEQLEANNKPFKIVKFDSACIDHHRGKDPHRFKPLLVIKQFLENRVINMEEKQTKLEHKQIETDENISTIKNTLDAHGNEIITIKDDIKELQRKIGLIPPIVDEQHQEEKQAEEFTVTPDQINPVWYHDAMIMKIWAQFAEHPDRNLRYYLGREDKGEGLKDRIEQHLFRPGLNLKQESALLLDNQGRLFETTTFKGDKTSLSFCSSIDHIPSRERNGESSKFKLALQQYAQWKENHDYLPRHCIMFPYHASDVHWVYAVLQLEFSEGQLQPHGYITLYDPQGPDEEIHMSRQVQNELVDMIKDKFHPAPTFQLTYQPPTLREGKRFVRQQSIENGNACGVLVAESGKDMIEGTTHRIAHGLYDETQLHQIRLQQACDSKDQRFIELQNERAHHHITKPKEPSDYLFTMLKNALRQLEPRVKETLIRDFIRLRKDSANSKKTDQNLSILKDHLLDHQMVLNVYLQRRECTFLSVFFDDEGKYKDGAVDLLIGLAQKIHFSWTSNDNNNFSKQLHEYFKTTQLLDGVVLEWRGNDLTLSSYAEYSLYQVFKRLEDIIMNHRNALDQAMGDIDEKEQDSIQGVLSNPDIKIDESHEIWYSTYTLPEHVIKILAPILTHVNAQNSTKNDYAAAEEKDSSKITTNIDDVTQEPLVSNVTEIQTNPTMESSSQTTIPEAVPTKQSSESTGHHNDTTEQKLSFAKLISIVQKQNVIIQDMKSRLKDSEDRITSLEEKINTRAQAPQPLPEAPSNSTNTPLKSEPLQDNESHLSSGLNEVSLFRSSPPIKEGTTATLENSELHGLNTGRQRANSC